MESSNLLFIVSFLWLLEILAVASNDSRREQCSFSKKCVCNTYDDGEYRIESAYCDAPEYWTAFKNTTKKYSFWRVSITGDISEIPSNAFSPFDKISHLHLFHRNDQKKQRLNWHNEAFSHLTVDALTISDMSQAIPPPVALKPLGEKGLKEFRIYLGGKEGIFLKRGTFSLFPKLNELSIFETTILGIDPSAFEGLNELTYLYLTSCSLDSFPPASIPSLTSLSLTDNKISSLENVHFPSDGITYLRLDGNPITSIDSCKWPTKLRTLYLNNAKLSYIDLSNFDGTKVWKLEANDMLTLKLLKVTRGVPDLAILYLSNTGLMEIDPSVGRVFDHADSVILDISNNKNLICDYEMRWIAKLAKDPENTVFIGDSVCANVNKTLEEYLKEIPPPEIPAPEIPAPKKPRKPLFRRLW